MVHAVGDSSFFPILTGLFRCRCGFEAVTEGRDADTPPLGWTFVVLTDGTHEHVCPRCSEGQPAETQ